ncbi:Protein SBE22 [Spathaspora sp. JA1]|nr:Protein SBE22 [Spathaspora sp. JA1]
MSPISGNTTNILNSEIPHESAKRPGDYFVQKLTTKSSLPQLTGVNKRMSADSFGSYHSSASDENSSIVSSQFDSPIPQQTPQVLQQLGITTAVPDCRLSSMTTATSIVNEAIVDSTYTLREDMSSSASSMAKQMSTARTSFLESSTSLISQQVPVYKLKSSSTSSMIHHHRSVAPAPVMKSVRSKSTASIPNLHRTKTRYLSSKETKERQILRKKKYEENDDDEEILSNDLDNLIFNVPVIKNTGELYRSNSSNMVSNNNYSLARSDSFTILSRSDLIDSHDNNKYNIASTNVKPCPLPGKLTISTTNLQNYQNQPSSSSSKMPTLDENSSIISSNDVSFNDEYEIAQNISQFYNNRSESMSKFLKLSRQDSIMYKLPTYIKSQSSMEDLHLISPEKLSLIDQTRPINLPPKNDQDKTKHNKEFKRVLSDYEVNTKNNNDERAKNAQIQLQYKQQWLKFIDSLSNLECKEFNKRFTYEKNNIRKLIWDCNIYPVNDRFNFLMKVLSTNQNSQDSINTIKNSFKLFDQKYQNLSESVKNNKNDEFDIIIGNCLQRPLIKCLLDDKEQFKTKYQYLLYIKSLSEFGLSKIDEIFLIPVLLLIFPNQTLIDIYCLLELLNQQVFDRDLISNLNSSLSSWSDIKQIPRLLSKFPSSEFDNLTSTTIFEMILQFSDQLPLSLSASSTPILTQAPTFEDPIYIENNKSACFELINKLLSMMIIYSNSIKSKTKNNMKVMQTFLICMFAYYHLNWNDYQELITKNIPLRINNSMDMNANLDSFVEKWKGIYKKC